MCTGFEENLAELADSEVFVEIMPITAMRCLFKHCMSMDGGGVDSAMSIRIALLMAVKFPSGDSNQAAKKAFDVARKAEQLMDNLSTSRGIPVRLPLPLRVIIYVSKINVRIVKVLHKLC